MDFRQIAIQAAQAAGVDPDIFLRQIQQESGFQPDVVSPAGAVGIAQIVPRWHPDVDPTDPVASLYYAARLMRSNLDQFGGRYDLALAAYNAGSGAVQQYGGIPPFPETQNYVASILGTGGGGKYLSEIPPEGDVSSELPPDQPPTDEPPPEEDGGGFDLSGIGNFFGGLLGNLGISFGGSTTPAGAPPFDPAKHQIISTTNLPGGTQVRYRYDNGEATTFIPKSGPTTGGTLTAEQAAAKAGYFKWDRETGAYEPDVDAFQAAIAAKAGAGARDKVLHYYPDGSVLIQHPDGSLSTRQIGPATARAGAGSRIQSLGGGRYLVIGPDGTVQERVFGGGQGTSDLTPPSLEPSRGRIVSYLQALLKQNALPYAGLYTPSSSPAAAGGAVPAPPAALSSIATSMPIGPLTPGVHPVIAPPFTQAPIATSMPIGPNTPGVHPVIGTQPFTPPDLGQGLGDLTALHGLLEPPPEREPRLSP